LMLKRNIVATPVLKRPIKQNKSIVQLSYSTFFEFLFSTIYNSHHLSLSYTGVTCRVE